MGMTSEVEGTPESEKMNGEARHADGRDGGQVDHWCESDGDSGLSRYRDQTTRQLAYLASTWDSLHKTWQALDRRAEAGSPALSPLMADLADGLKASRDQVGRKLSSVLEDHPLWPWLEPLAGVRGVHTARVISLIGDPLRFPGRKCAAGHHVPEDYDAETCPVPLWQDGESEICGDKIGPVRRGTGVRSVWHFLGLHVDETGRSPRKRKGVKCTWNPIGRTACLQPDGIADQIIRHRVDPYRTTYDEQKARLEEERGIRSEVDLEIESRSGADGNGSGADVPCEIASPVGSALRPFQVHGIARKIAVKQFVGDLLVEWKRVAKRRGRVRH